jgi:O-antigen/teichoic acid export membrane protein
VATSGLGANLVRQEEEPEEADYRAVFTAQIGPILLASVALGLGAGPVAGLYGLPDGGVRLMQWIALAFAVSSFTTIPMNRLERHLMFRQVALIEIAQMLAFQSVAVAFALRGNAILGFGIAVLARAGTGAVMANLFCPWLPRFTRDVARIRRHARFGVVFQAAFLVSALKDSITTVFVGILMGTASVGMLGWARMVSSYPVLELTLQFANACAAPFAVASLVLVNPITVIIFGEKWLAALPCFYFLWLSNLFVPSTTPLLSLLNARGEPGIVLRFAILWAVATWAIGVPLILAFGEVGFAAANAAVQLTNLLLYRVARSRLDFRLFRPVAPIWGLAGLLGAGLLGVQAVRPAGTLLDLVLYGGGMVLAFAALLSVWQRRRFANALRLLRGTA